MSQLGRITSWNDERGFGFITPIDGGRRVFVHISAFVNRTRRPQGDEPVTYQLETDHQGRPRACGVSFDGDRLNRSTRDRRQVTGSLIVAACFLSLVALLALAGRLPFLLLVIYCFMSTVTFAAYASDKSAARRGQWRTSEGMLHLLGLSGGWPGALVARHVFHHKSRKPSFIVEFWGTVLVNCGALGWLLTPAGRRLLQALLEAA